MRTKEIKIENKFPNHQFDEIIVTRNDITVVYFKVNKEDKVYRFFVNNNEELDRRLIERCKTLTIEERRIKHAIVGVWEHIDFLLNNPTWKPAPSIEWVDKYDFKCPYCGEICNVNNRSYIPDEDAEMGLRYDFDFTCLNCKKDYPDNLWENLHFFIDEDADERYIRDKYIYEKRLSKETELEYRSNLYRE